MRGPDGSQSVLTAVGPNSIQLQPILRTHSLRRQPLCGDAEGWGPVSSIRWDFTPCFLDLWIIGVAAWGVLFGAGALWYLFKKRTAQEVPKNWHFYTKLYATSVLGDPHDLWLSVPALISIQFYNYCHSCHHKPSGRTPDRTTAIDMVQRHQVLHIKRYDCLPPRHIHCTIS